jgi:hypothetical protein
LAASFETIKVRAIQTGRFGKLVLRKSSFASKLCDTLANDNMKVRLQAIRLGAMLL